MPDRDPTVVSAHVVPTSWPNAPGRYDVTFTYADGAEHHALLALPLDMARECAGSAFLGKNGFANRPHRDPSTE